MKKIITLLIIFPVYFLSFSFTPKDVDSALANLYTEIMYTQPQSYPQEDYVELAYLKRKYNLSKININDNAYRSKIINNFYYDQYYLYSKFLNENAIVTEDCINIPESTESMHKGNKLLFYTLYPNSIKLPADIVDQLDEYATVDEFFGPYKMLTDIYFLKKYNYQKLSATQKEKLNTVETHLCKILYSKYIDNKPWSFHKLLSVKVLKMNKSELIKNLDLSQVVNYFKENKPLVILDEDLNSPILKVLSVKNIIPQQALAILWIFC